MCVARISGSTKTPVADSPVNSAGGLMDFAYNFIMQNGGLDTEKDYKYKALQGQCNVGKENRHVVTIDGYEDVPPMDEVSLAKVRPGRILDELQHDSGFHR